ncbi:hypothetical protein SO802_004649 [Lithocarpus litseifolius]|uniref:Uncharacterized protein n=1 Tax=Lithocarpus litseifolius TaxID=425828 RepID=A0AAW2E3K6_9ROSI
MVLQRKPKTSLLELLESHVGGSIPERIKDLNVKLTEANRDKKSAEAALAGAERQAEDQRQQLHKVEDQLTIAKEQMGALKKQLKKAKEAATHAEYEGYDTSVKENKENLRAQVTGVCRGYCLQVWIKALN